VARIRTAHQACRCGPDLLVVGVPGCSLQDGEVSLSCDDIAYSMPGFFNVHVVEKALDCAETATATTCDCTEGYLQALRGVQHVQCTGSAGTSKAEWEALLQQRLGPDQCVHAMAVQQMLKQEPESLREGGIEHRGYQVMVLWVDGDVGDGGRCIATVCDTEHAVLVARDNGGWCCDQHSIKNGQDHCDHTRAVWNLLTGATVGDSVNDSLALKSGHARTVCTQTHAFQSVRVDTISTKRWLQALHTGGGPIIAIT